MKRRHALALAAMPLVALPARAGVIDWANGVRVGRVLPAFDTQWVGPPPAPGAALRLIDFWATWCAPCREEFPHLNRLQARFAGEGLAVMGLSQEPLPVVTDFLPKVRLEYPVGAGGSQPLQKQLGIRALPYAVLVNRADVIVWRGQASSLTEAALVPFLAAAQRVTAAPGSRAHDAGR